MLWYLDLLCANFSRLNLTQINAPANLNPGRVRPLINYAPTLHVPIFDQAKNSKTVLPFTVDPVESAVKLRMGAKHLIRNCAHTETFETTSVRYYMDAVVTELIIHPLREKY